ncbi:myelin-associated glycoprotein-like [Dendropsophus ebraccatus]|uniref:myelin-associated glycoprotein-like n=1 Tax=Dendropsophus ebraccatus TaxID=150705 RepID=UPI00383112F0
MEAVKQVYLLLICQGFYLGSVCQQRMFPYTITALLGSCVEIPCTYDPVWASERSGIIWYVYGGSGYPEILNTKDSSSVLEEYRGRTSLVPGENSCTLRIDPVRRKDGGRYYYPGTIEDKIQKEAGVFLNVTDKANIELYGSGLMTEGEATTMRCIVENICGSTPPSLQWNRYGYVQQKSVIMRGSWRIESILKYIPLYKDDGGSIECIATYHNLLTFWTSGLMNVKYAPKNVTVTVIDAGMEGGDVRLQCNSFSNPYVHEYEWYKGKEKSRLPETGREITVRKVTRDMEPYSCTARNIMGRGESALTQLPASYKASRTNSLILPVTIGTICLLLLLLLVFYCWRIRCQMLRSNEVCVIRY